MSVIFPEPRTALQMLAAKIFQDRVALAVGRWGARVGGGAELEALLACRMRVCVRTCTCHMLLCVAIGLHATLWAQRACMRRDSDCPWPFSSRPGGMRMHPN